MVALTGLLLFNVWMLLSPPQLMMELLTLMPLPQSGRAVLLIGVAINMAVSIVFEEYVALRLASGIGKLVRRSRQATRHHDRKTYKAVEGGMR
jgi:hypothetical protein